MKLLVDRLTDSPTPLRLRGRPGLVARRRRRRSRSCAATRREALRVEVHGLPHGRRTSTSRARSTGAPRARVQPLPRALSSAASRALPPRARAGRGRACPPSRKRPRRWRATASASATSSRRAGSGARRSISAPSCCEVVTLALPVQPLCREDCRGLCPRCGVGSQHETRAAATEASPTSPFAVLRSAARDRDRKERADGGSEGQDLAHEARTSGAPTTRSRAPARAKCPQCGDAEAAPPRVRELRQLPRPRGRSQTRRGVERARARAALSRAGLAGGRHGSRRLRGVARRRAPSSRPRTPCSASRSRGSASRGPRRSCCRTEIQQPAILATSIALLRALEERVRARARPSSRATASASTPRSSRPARSTSRTRCALVHARGRFMQEAVRRGTRRDGGDARLRADVVERACAARAQETRPRRRRRPTSTAPAQTVIAGDAVAVERLRAAPARPARSAPLAAPGVGAVPLRADGARRREARARARARALPRDPQPPVVTNVEAAPNADRGAHPGAARARRSRRRCASPRWCERLAALGVTRVLEIGPGRVLIGPRRAHRAGLGRAEPHPTLAGLADGPRRGGDSGFVRRAPGCRAG